ncbi:MAG: hypothetical protein ACKV0T_06805 [Planctomycetales bacterium]
MTIRSLRTVPPVIAVALGAFFLGRLSQPRSHEPGTDLAGVVHADPQGASVTAGPILAAGHLGAANGNQRALPEKGIRRLTQHFNEPDGDFSPWMFVPEGNIQTLSTSRHPGLVTIYEAGRGTDIKGLLKDPIRIDEFPLPWEFQTSLVQSFNAQAGVGARTQVNYAIGLNLAVTFSDPETWPEERTVRPAQTRDFQLLVVHLGCTGEAGVGLPQYTHDPHPENYLVWGRGDLGHPVLGDWRIPYVWIGDGAKYGGPASPQLFFRAVLESPTSINVGIKFDASHGWNMRRIDCSKYGKITGIWELGPIISGDRWIPDVLCRSLPQLKGPHPLQLGQGDSRNYKEVWSFVGAPEPEPPNPKFEYYVDYCTFFGAPPRPFEEFSDDFDILGYMGQWQIQEQSTLADTHSHPGHLMLKFLGPGLGTGFGPAGGSSLDFQNYPPPWEIEISFHAPDDSIPWNFWMNFVVVDQAGKNRGGWTPGIENFPKEKRHRLYGNSLFKLKFDQELPESLLAHKPLTMLIQCLDRSHVRLGFRAGPNDPWILSQVYDAAADVGGEIGRFDIHNWSSATGEMYGAPPGGPMYQKFLIDYVHYRKGLTVR